ncbi:ABC transporter substrate-binding protein [Brachybacterium alimentarium]|uniref:ABC transporter substrate-binding protein n=1 Tax=Brachybacterium alimentarium TaxID=47845 RepID=A0A2A3YFI9_9MICO|nr:sugar ABC transporter substrate-binding protein [Brachybacterium alimentarium]PCC38001.1 ABC transporter substrate-binding protein [Brachybacterium alimentarium]
MLTRRDLMTGGSLTGLLLLSGCGLQPTGGPTVASGPIGTDIELEGAIRFQTWNLRSAYLEYFEGLIDEFVAAHPGASVDWVDQPADGYADNLQVDASNLDLPDVMNLAPDLAWPLAQAGLLLDIADARPEVLDGYADGAIEDYSGPQAGTAFAYPWYLNTGPIFYNRALFEEAGLDPDDPPTTWDELFDLADAMGDAVDGRFYMIGQLPAIADFGMYGVQVLDDNQERFTFNDERAVRMVERYRQAYERKGLLPDSTVLTYTGGGERFQSGQVALSTGSAYDVANFKENAPDLYANLGITETLTDTGHANMFSQGIAVSSRTEHPEVAIAFAEFLTSQEKQMEFAHIVDVFPSTEGALEDPYFTEDDGSDTSEVRVVAAGQLDSARNYTPVVWTEEMRVELQRQVGDAVVGRITAQEALDASVAQANRLAGVSE